MRARWHAELRWEDVLFVHWPVDPNAIKHAVPDRLSIDVRGGRAWLSIVALSMADVGPPGTPTGYTFPEVNLRTYVDDGESAVYFFSIDAPEPVGTRISRLVERVSRVVGRASAASSWQVRLPYHRARVDLERDGNAVVARSIRGSSGNDPATFAAVANPDADCEFTPAPGSLPSFLMDRHRFYATIGEHGGPGVDRLLLASGAVVHGPWRLRPASITVIRDGVFDAAGLPTPRADPIAYYCSAMPGVAARIDPRLTKS